MLTTEDKHNLCIPEVRHNPFGITANLAQGVNWEWAVKVTSSQSANMDVI